MVLLVGQEGVVARGFGRFDVQHGPTHQRLVEERDVTLAGTRQDVVDESVEGSAGGRVTHEEVGVDWWRGAK